MAIRCLNTVGIWPFANAYILLLNESPPLRQSKISVLLDSSRDHKGSRNLTFKRDAKEDRSQEGEHSPGNGLQDRTPLLLVGILIGVDGGSPSQWRPFSGDPKGWRALSFPRQRYLQRVAREAVSHNPPWRDLTSPFSIVAYSTPP